MLHWYRLLFLQFFPWPWVNMGILLQNSLLGSFSKSKIEVELLCTNPKLPYFPFFDWSLFIFVMVNWFSKAVKWSYILLVKHQQSYSCSDWIIEASCSKQLQGESVWFVPKCFCAIWFWPRRVSSTKFINLFHHTLG